MNKPSEKLVCDVRVQRILYPRIAFEPGSFAIAACEVVNVHEGEPYAENIVVKGRVFAVAVGAVYHLTGTLTQEEKYGESYKIESFDEEYNLETADEQDAYLQVVLTPGQYMSLKAALPNPFETLRAGDVQTISGIKGFGKASAERMVNKFNARLDQAKAFSHLGKYGMTVEGIASLLERVPSVDKLISMIDNDPYVMIDCVDGIGWSRADAIAQKRGINGTDPRRVQAYIKYFLHTRADAGHTWCPPQELWDAMSFDLNTDDQSVLRDALYTLHEAGKIWWDESKTKIALTSLRNLEERIAKELYRIASSKPLKPAKDADLTIKMMEEEQGWKFTDEQMKAIHGTLSCNVSIITGYGGTGKSSAVRGVLKLLGNHPFAQCALSGRAAARLTEVTGVAGSTIHRLLGYQPGIGFVFNKDNPLPEDIIILDEVSMVGAEIFIKLLEAIRTGAKLIMLGDDGQLEAIGLCNLFRDMLDSGVIKVGRLTKIHRQAAKSAIITEAAKVRQQMQLCDKDWVGREIRGELQDLELEVYHDSILTRDNIVDAYKRLIESGVSRHKIQIIVPMKTRGEACTLRINRDIQSYINAENEYTGILVGAEGATESYYLRLGDRVICTKNYYDAQHPDETVCPVYNGDRGIITSINQSQMIITFDLWGDIVFPRSKYNQIELGYALSCHKLQGSEADYVIIGFDMASNRLLTKEWLYTAITRAKKYCVLTAESKALRFCISTSNIPYKRTFLKDLLKEVFHEKGRKAY